MDDVVLAKTDENILETYELIGQLHERIRALSMAEYLKLVRQQERELGYQLVYVIKNQKAISVAGFRRCQSLGWGRYLYVDDLVTDHHHRSIGVGKKIFEWLVTQARAEGCREIRLDCRLDRHGAHRFYFRERMEIRCFHFGLSV